MASKMSAAVDKNNKKITISMAENLDYKPPLTCEFCDAEVSFVNGFSREVGDKVIYVTPFFRLKRKFIHNSGCDYNLEGQVSVIVRESEGNILAQTESGKYELRLLAVRKAIQELQELVKKKNKVSHDTQNESIERKYIKSRKRLGSYINTALRVLKVRSLCEDNVEIENLLELVFDGVRLPWRDFYYEDKDYFRCHSYLRKSTVAVPVAIIGVVKSIKIIDGKKEKFTVINLIGPYRKTNDRDILDSANVSIWSLDLEMMNNYKENDEILAFGIWEAREVDEKSYNSKISKIKAFRNHDLRLWPVSKSQLCKIKD